MTLHQSSGADEAPAEYQSSIFLADTAPPVVTALEHYQAYSRAIQREDIGPARDILIADSSGQSPSYLTAS